MKNKCKYKFYENKTMVYFCNDLEKNIPYYEERDRIAHAIVKNGFKCPYCKTELKNEIETLRGKLWALNHQE